MVTMLGLVHAAATAPSATIASVPCWLRGRRPLASARRLEKPGLLPPRLDDAGFPEDGVRTACARRPADVWVPSWGLHGPAAFDLAATVGLRPGRHAAVAAAADRPAADYEARKSSHLNTRAVCEAQGLQFIPLVVEASGGWAPSAVRTWKELAAAQCGSAALAASSADRGAGVSGI